MEKAKGLWFGIGDTLVYPGYGVGVVESIQERAVGEKTRTFCVLLFKGGESESKVMIPVDNVKEVRLRRPAKKDAVKKALDYLSNGEPEILPSWRDRFQSHGDKLAQGDLASVAEVLKALHVLNDKKPLSFREKKMYQKALLLLTAEACEVLGQSREDLEASVLDRLAGKPA